MTAHRAPLKEGDTVYVMDKKVRGKVPRETKVPRVATARGYQPADQGAPRRLEADPSEDGVNLNWSVV